MKNNKKTWIIAFVSGFISATVAFSAFNYIFNKQKIVDEETKIESSAQKEESTKNEAPPQKEGSAKMTFTRNDGSALENNSISPVIVDGKTEASNLLKLGSAPV